jgi:hypothetical protein
MNAKYERIAQTTKTMMKALPIVLDLLMVII